MISNLIFFSGLGFFLFQDNIILRLSLAKFLGLFGRYAMSLGFGSAAFYPDLIGFGISGLFAFLLSDEYLQIYRGVINLIGSILFISLIPQLYTIIFAFSRALKEKINFDSEKLDVVKASVLFLSAIAIIFTLKNDYDLIQLLQLNKGNSAYTTALMITLVLIFSHLLLYILTFTRNTYDAIVLNPALCALVASYLAKDILRDYYTNNKGKPGMSAECDLSSFFILVKHIWNLFKVTKLMAFSQIWECLGLKIIVYIILPFLSLYTFRATKDEWRLFFYGQIKDSKTDESAAKPPSMLKGVFDNENLGLMLIAVLEIHILQQSFSGGYVMMISYLIGVLFFGLKLKVSDLIYHN